MTLLFIVGATASGKTAVAVEVAGRLNGEVIGLDSMQIYQGLPVLTAAPEPEELQRVPHHLIAEIPLSEALDVRRYRDRVLETAKQVVSRGAVPIIAGGSGLYYSVLVEGISNLPSADDALRHKLNQQAQDEGADSIHAELARLDPTSADRLHANDLHRVIRALEVCILTGRPYSEQIGGKEPLAPDSHITFGLQVPREELYRRIDARASRMLDEGAISELASTLGTQGWPGDAGPAGPGRLRTASQLLGIRQLLPFLAGEADREKALECLSRDSRRLARRQSNWFRRFPAIHWIDASSGQPPEELAEKVMEEWNRRTDPDQAT